MFGVPMATLLAVFIIIMVVSKRTQRGLDPALRDEIRQLREESEALRQESMAHEQAISELAERLDFAERMLAQVRDHRSLPPSEP